MIMYNNKYMINKTFRMKLNENIHTKNGSKKQTHIYIQIC